MSHANGFLHARGQASAWAQCVVDDGWSARQVPRSGRPCSGSC